MNNWIWILSILLIVLVAAFMWLEFVYFAGDKKNDNEN